MMPLELKKTGLLFKSAPYINQLPQRSLEVIKEKHFEQERIPANISILKIAWTILAATYFYLRTAFHK